MNGLIPINSPTLPVLVVAAGERALIRFLEFFAVKHPQPAHAASLLPGGGRIPDLVRKRPRAVDRRRQAGACRHLDRDVRARAGGALGQTAPRGAAPPGRLAGQRPGRAGQPGAHRAQAPTCRDVRSNAGARSGRGARSARQHRHRHRRGLRNRALIALIFYSFAASEPRSAWQWKIFTRRIDGFGAAAREGWQTPHDAVSPQPRRIRHLDRAGLRDDPKGPLFRAIGRGTGRLTRTVLPQANAYAMIRRRAAAESIATKLGNHSFRATGSAPTSRMANRWKRRRRRRTMPRRARSLAR